MVHLQFAHILLNDSVGVARWVTLYEVHLVQFVHKRHRYICWLLPLVGLHWCGDNQLHHRLRNFAKTWYFWSSILILLFVLGILHRGLQLRMRLKFPGEGCLLLIGVSS